MSIMLSPLLRLLDDALKLSVWAPRFLAAISKENRVLVEFSKGECDALAFERWADCIFLIDEQMLVKCRTIKNLYD